MATPKCQLQKGGRQNSFRLRTGPLILRNGEMVPLTGTDKVGESYVVVDMPG